MPNLLASLSSAGNALDVFQQALSVIQNNVNNSSTPGYATQSLNLQAQPFVITGGLTGGVAAQGLLDSRDSYAEEQVQQQTQLLGQYTAQAQATGTIQSFFDVTGTGGLPTALNNLLNAFSAWSVTPTDANAGRNVLAAAQALASSINGLSNSLSRTSQHLDTQMGSTVSQINDIATQIQQYNQQVVRDSRPDPGVQAQLYASLDDLSQLTNFTTITQSDGTISVMLGGGSPLVIGTQVNALSQSNFVDANPAPAYPNSPPAAHILDSDGNDITSQITSGQLGGLLDSRNRVLGSLLGTAQQQGSLNQFAQTLADTVNQIQQSGTVSATTGAAAGAAIFTYDSSNLTSVAATLAVDPAMTTAQLAPVDSSGNANGNAIQLANLGNAGNTTINGMTLLQFLAQMSSWIGQENQTATTNQTTQQQVAAQATKLRDQVSGVSLDQQATQVLQFQRAYQASAQVLTVLNTILDSTIQMMAASQ